jgi:hypothetical protein
MKRKSNQFTVRLDEELRAAVEECAKITGLDPALFMREAFKAFVSEVREKGEIRLPLALIPKRKLALSELLDLSAQSEPAAIAPMIGLVADPMPSAAPLPKSAPGKKVTYPKPPKHKGTPMK